MTSLSSRTATSFVLALTLFACGPAWARQSDSDLRRENQQLKTQVQDLEKELEAARKESEALKQRITQLEQQLAAARRSTTRPGTGLAPLEEDKVTIDESVPTASPRALIKAIQAEYEEQTADVDAGKPGDRIRIAFLRQLQRWESQAEREHRTPIEWCVRAVDARRGDYDRDRGRERIVTFVAVDPETDVRLGDPFDVRLSKTLASRLADLEDRGELDVLVLKGTLYPDIIINEERTERGSFDNPRFIGPFVEFRYTVEPATIVPFDPEKQKEKPAARPSGEKKDEKEPSEKPEK